MKSDTAKFLGVLIRTSFLKDSQQKKVINGFSKRVGNMNIIMNSPIKTLIQRLEDKGFIKRFNNKIKALPMTSLSPLPTVSLILRYRSIMKGYSNYYSFADNIGRLKYIYVLLRNSLERTICSKEKLNKHEFHLTYGKDICVSITKSDGTKVSLDFACPKLVHAPVNFLYNEVKDPLLAKI